jgi:uncharacterized protein (DUF2235 family)
MKNIVICCDGTGNEISENISNVLKLYRTLRKTEKTTPRQMVFYDPGVGTLARQNAWKKLVQDASAIFGLATGYGLDDNVLDSYEFIVDNYDEGDAIYLFGFSRGAYTVRMLAGLIHKIGLISKQQVNLAGSGLTAYKQFSSDAPQPDGGLDLAQFTDGGAVAAKADQAAQYARILSVRWPTIKFVGVWDTVASVIVPRPDRLYLPSLQVLAFVHRNPSIEIFRHAISNGAGCSGRSGGTRAANSGPAASRRKTNGRTRIPCRCGSPAFMPISAAAIRKFRARCRNIRCCG